MRVDTASRRIAARPEAVYAAFVDADRLLSWLPPAGMSGRLEAFDPRVGGGYRMVLTYRDPPAAGGKFDSSSDVADVRFDELDPPRRIVQHVLFPSSEESGSSSSMTMTWTFDAVGDSTDVTVRAEDVPDAISAEDHRRGIAASLANLASVLEHGA